MIDTLYWMYSLTWLNVMEVDLTNFTTVESPRTCMLKNHTDTAAKQFFLIGQVCIAILRIYAQYIYILADRRGNITLCIVPATLGQWWCEDYDCASECRHVRLRTDWIKSWLATQFRASGFSFSQPPKTYHFSSLSISSISYCMTQLMSKIMIIAYLDIEKLHAEAW